MDWTTNSRSFKRVNAMLFKFPKNKIVLDCFTTKEHILKTAPVDLATKYLPEWWKELPLSYTTPKTFFPEPTMKSCRGLVDYYRHGVIIPLWTDLAIEIKPHSEYRWQFADNVSTATYHDTGHQAKGFLSNYGNVKLDSPWFFSTKENIKWVWTAPTYNFKEHSDIVFLPGVIDFKNQTATNINMMINLETPKILTLKHCQPLVNLIPMSDRNIKIERHLVSEEELKKLMNRSARVSFLKNYQTKLKATERFSGCPYHNHLKELS